MFSRSGIGTTVADLTFQPDELKGSEGVNTTFPTTYFRNQKVIEEEGQDDEEAFKDEYQDFKKAET